MRVLKVAVWGMGLVIIALVGVLFWKVAEIYGEKTDTAENPPIVETGSAPVTAADAAAPVVVKPVSVPANQAVVTIADGKQIVIDLPGELKDISASNGMILLQVRLEKKRWMAISIDQSNGAILSRVVLNSQ